MATRLILSLFAVFVLGFSVFAQGLDRDSTPLDAALYLLSKTSPDSNKEEKACLANALASTRRYDQAKKVAGLVDHYSYTDVVYVGLIDKLIEAKHFREALDFVTFLLNKDKDFDATKFIDPLVRLGQIQKANDLAKNEDGSLDPDNYLKLIDVLLRLGRNTDAANAADRIQPVIFKKPYPTDKARLGLFYAKIRIADKAVPLIDAALKNVVWTNGLPPPDDQFIQDDAFHAYLLLGQYDKAISIADRLGKGSDARWLIPIANSYIVMGNRTLASEYLSRARMHLDPNDYGDSFDLGELVKSYLMVGNDDQASNIARNLTGSEYMRQQSLLRLADYYFRGKRRQDVRRTLGFASEQTAKMKVVDTESGQLSTSGKWEQARYQAEIARSLLKYGESQRAYEVISQIRKPYLKALLLAEYVSRGRISKAGSTRAVRGDLDQSVKLLREGKEEIFDSNKYDTYAKVARTYAEIGMTQQANSLFAEVLSMDRQMYDKGLDPYLLRELCNIGVEFERSKLKSDDNIRVALRNIVRRFEDEEY